MTTKTPFDLVREIIPLAQDIEGPYTCPVCRNETEYSYRVEKWKQYDRDGEQAVGFVCVSSTCTWQNAGWRS